jgi:hypothetical protein
MAFSSGVAAADEQPFQAILAGNASFSPTDDPLIRRNDETGQGVATVLGEFTWASVEFVNFKHFPPGVKVKATFAMTATNGDQIFGKYVTHGDLNAAGDQIDIVGEFEITGGTGQFAGASGGGILTATAYLAPGFPFDGMFDGTIDY